MPETHVVITDHKESEINTDLLTQWIQSRNSDIHIQWSVHQLTGRPKDEVIDACRNVDILIVDMLDLDSEIISELHRTQLILRHGAGVDNVDVAAASQRGIVVGCYPDYCTDEVAEHTVGLLFALSRKIPSHNTGVRNGEWNCLAHGPQFKMRGKTLGLIGCGRIGQRVAQMVQGFGLTLLTYDPYLSEDQVNPFNVEQCSLADVLENSDFISIHTPLTDETRLMIGPSELSRMKPGSFLINTARGAIVDFKALVNTLNRQDIAGAALDVLPCEPPFQISGLLECPNLILTPHVAWYSENAIQKIWQCIAADINAFIAGRRICSPV